MVASSSGRSGCAASRSAQQACGAEQACGAAEPLPHHGKRCGSRVTGSAPPPGRHWSADPHGRRPHRARPALRQAEAKWVADGNERLGCAAACSGPEATQCRPPLKSRSARTWYAVQGIELAAVPDGGRAKRVCGTGEQAAGCQWLFNRPPQQWACSDCHIQIKGTHAGLASHTPLHGGTGASPPARLGSAPAASSTSATAARSASTATMRALCPRTSCWSGEAPACGQDEQADRQVSSVAQQRRHHLAHQQGSTPCCHTARLLHLAHWPRLWPASPTQRCHLPRAARAQC